jgi:hypothetical protein
MKRLPKVATEMALHVLAWPPGSQRGAAILPPTLRSAGVPGRSPPWRAIEVWSIKEPPLKQGQFIRGTGGTSPRTYLLVTRPPMAVHRMDDRLHDPPRRKPLLFFRIRDAASSLSRVTGWTGAAGKRGQRAGVRDDFDRADGQVA